RLQKPFCRVHCWRPGSRDLNSELRWEKGEVFDHRAAGRFGRRRRPNPDFELERSEDFPGHTLLSGVQSVAAKHAKIRDHCVLERADCGHLRLRPLLPRGADVS
ncbi:unnamed protein product, partial [Amoebophrya sp. A120]